MGSSSVERMVRIVNPEGLHARPADMFVKLASRFAAHVELINEHGQSADGKSILAILTLAAEQGTKLTIKATGDNAEEALEALVELVETGFA
jgi:phosphotransferase system HPr (HPr) family protein